MSARCSGIAAQFHSFDFFFGVFLGEKVLGLADNLSKSLQHQNISAAHGQTMAAHTIQSLRDMRTDEEFDSFWRVVMTGLEEVDVAEPSWPRKRRAPSRFETGTTAGYFSANVEDYYRSIFFEALDTITQCISTRFDQPGFQTYSKLEAVLLKGSAGDCYDNDLDVVMRLYPEDLEEQLLRSQLLLLKSHFKNSSPPGLMNIAKFVQENQQLLSEVVKLLVLVLVAPATNATSERCFSALRIVKTYLRSTMGQARLNHLLILHAHKEACDNLCLEQCANDFCFHSEHRRNIFDSFSS